MDVKTGTDDVTDVTTATTLVAERKPANTTKGTTPPGVEGAAKTKAKTDSETLSKGKSKGKSTPAPPTPLPDLPVGSDSMSSSGSDDTISGNKVKKTKGS